jgi:hypothetical protein
MKIIRQIQVTIDVNKIDKKYCSETCQFYIDKSPKDWVEIKKCTLFNFFLFADMKNNQYMRCDKCLKLFEFNQKKNDY